MKSPDQLDMLNESAQIILQTRGFRRITFFSFVATFIVTTVTYLMDVYPAFLPADLTNPAIDTYMASDEYKETTGPLFDNLNKYNNDTTGNVNEPMFKLAHSDVTQFGLVVSYQINRVPQDQVAPQNNRNPEKPVKIKYKYDTDFQVRPDYRILLFFLAFEVSVVIAAILSVFPRRPLALVKYEEAVLTHFFSPHGLIPSENSWRPSTEEILDIIFSNFHLFCIQLKRRSREGKIGFPVEDEYDVQDILYALLKLHFPIVKREEPVPSFMGASSRIDFLLPKEQIGIEAKMPRKGLRDGKLGVEFITDFTRYPKHPECERIIFFVYDPDHLIENPALFQSDIQERNPEIPVDVIFSPAATTSSDA